MTAFLFGIAFTGAFVLAPAARAQVEERIGKIYRLKDTSGEPLFVQKTRVDRSKTGMIVITGEITDAAGKEALREKAVIENGRIKSQTMEQLQIGERYELTIEDGKAKMKSFKTGDAAGDKLDGENTEEAGKDYVTGPGMEVFLLEKLAALEKGTSVIAKFGVFEVLRAVNFEFRKEEKSLSGAPGALGLRMKPDSFWLKLLVDTIYFDIDRETGRLLRFRGRTPVRIRENDQWKALDAEILYELAPGKGK